MFHILPATAEDGRELMHVGYLAFEHDPHNKTLLPDPMSPEQRAEYIEWRRRVWTTQLGEENKQQHSVKAVDGM